MSSQAIPSSNTTPSTTTTTNTITATSSNNSTKLLILISGHGSNLQALISACNNNTSHLPAYTSIIRVISNRKDAYGLQRAHAAQIPTTYHNLVKYKKQHPTTDSGVQAAREEYDQDLARLIVDAEPDLVVCAGFMHVLSEGFCARVAEAGIDVINLHPALPGKYNGAGAIDRAYDDFVNQKGNSWSTRSTGVMVHYVIAEVDMGEPIVVQEVEMKEGESKQELEERIHEVEHGLIVEGTRIALERIRQRRKSTLEDGAG